MKLLMLILALATALLGYSFDKNEIMSLTPAERSEVLQKLSPRQRNVLADSLTRWGSQEVLIRNAQMASEFKGKLGQLEALMNNSQMMVEKMAAQVGFSMIVYLLLLIVSLVLGCLAFKKKNLKFFRSFYISSIGVTLFYAFIMFIVF